MEEAERNERRYKTQMTVLKERMAALDALAQEGAGYHVVNHDLGNPQSYTIPRDETENRGECETGKRGSSRQSLGTIEGDDIRGGLDLGEFEILLSCSYYK